MFFTRKQCSGGVVEACPCLTSQCPAKIRLKRRPQLEFWRRETSCPTLRGLHPQQFHPQEVSNTFVLDRLLSTTLPHQVTKNQAQHSLLNSQGLEFDLRQTDTVSSSCMFLYVFVQRCHNDPQCACNSHFFYKAYHID